MRKIAALLLVFTLLPVRLFAWGTRGHEVIADIAYSRLMPRTRRNVALLLGNESLTLASTWADAVRQKRPETFGWHFVDIPEDAQGFNEQRDCFRPQDKHKDARIDHHNCAVDRIESFSRVLASPRATRQQRTEALEWVVHLVGDLHQPLHAIAEAHGGNDIKLPVFGETQCGDHSCNLHGAWDVALLEHASLSEGEYVRRIQALIRAEGLDSKAGRTPEDWANESHAEAHAILQQRPAKVDDLYYQSNIHLVDERLALAGLRLAALLNRTLGSIPTEQLRQELRRQGR
ncbi:MAG TPA: S1/P1 nuclease [Candidatus Angelobacter sp.]|nr:S1/P1 nuclease [Candidatus Angelobacter sp.]